MYHPACVKREYKPLCAYVGRLWGIQCVCACVCVRVYNCVWCSAVLRLNTLKAKQSAGKVSSPLSLKLRIKA